jgi:hypothetical protein
MGLVHQVNCRLTTINYVAQVFNPPKTIGKYSVHMT